MTTTTALATQSTVLSELIAQSGLREEKAVILTSSFETLESDIALWNKRNESLVIKSNEDKASIEMAKTAYKHIKSIRIDIENRRKELKAEALAEGKAIDSIAKALTELVTPLEVSLQEKAKYLELYEAKIKAEKLSKRLASASSLGFAVSATLIENMSDDMFTTYLEGLASQELKRKEQEAKAKAEEEARAKAEAERVAKEKEEQEQIRLENERLKAEKLEAERLQAIKDAELEKARKADLAEAQRLQAIRDAEIAKEKAEAEAERKEAKRLQDEKDAQIAKLKAEAEAKAEAERKESQAKAEAEKKALEAPERERLEKVLREAGMSIESIESPSFLAIKERVLNSIYKAISDLNEQ